MRFFITILDVYKRQINDCVYRGIHAGFCNDCIAVMCNLYGHLKIVYCARRAQDNRTRITQKKICYKNQYGYKKAHLFKIKTDSFVPKNQIAVQLFLKFFCGFAACKCSQPATHRTVDIAT